MTVHGNGRREGRGPFRSESRADSRGFAVRMLLCLLLAGCAAAPVMERASFFQWARQTASRSKGDLGGLASRFIGDINRRKKLLYQMEARASAVEKLLGEEFETKADARIYSS